MFTVAKVLQFARSHNHTNIVFRLLTLWYSYTTSMLVLSSKAIIFCIFIDNKGISLTFSWEIQNKTITLQKKKRTL